MGRSRCSPIRPTSTTGTQDLRKYLVSALFHALAGISLQLALRGTDKGSVSPMGGGKNKLCSCLD